MEVSWDKIKYYVKKTKDLQLIGISNIVAKAIAGLFWFYMAALLGTENYGEVTYFVAIGSTAATLALIGSPTTLIVYTAKKIPIQPPIYFITLILGTISAIIVFLIFQNWLVSVFTIGYVIFNLAIAYLLGRKYYKKYSIYFIIQKILFVGFSLVFYFAIGHLGVVLGFALSFLVFSPIIIKGFREVKLDFGVLKERFGFLMNSYALSVERIFNGQVDKIILAPMFGFSLLGNFALGLQFLALISILPTIVYQYTLSQDASGSPRYIIKKLSILSSVGIAGLSILLSPILLPIVFPEFVEAIQIIQIVSVGAVPHAINLSYISKFLGQEKSRIVLLGQVITLSIYLSGLFILGHFFGINGVAASLVFAGIAQSIFYFIADRFLIESKFFKKSNQYF